MNRITGQGLHEAVYYTELQLAIVQLWQDIKMFIERRC